MIKEFPSLSDFDGTALALTILLDDNANKFTNLTAESYTNEPTRFANANLFTVGEGVSDKKRTLAALC